GRGIVRCGNVHLTGGGYGGSVLRAQIAPRWVSFTRSVPPAAVRADPVHRDHPLLSHLAERARREPQVKSGVVEVEQVVIHRDSRLAVCLSRHPGAAAPRAAIEKPKDRRPAHGKSMQFMLDQT